MGDRSVPCNERAEVLVSVTEAIEMSKPSDLVQGTLDMLLLKILALEPMNGFVVSQRLKQVSGDVLQVSDGSLYPALHKLEQEGWITAEWKPTENKAPGWDPGYPGTHGHASRPHSENRRRSCFEPVRTPIHACPRNLHGPDVDSIPIGLDFRKYLHDAVSRCDALVAVIGKNWCDAKTPGGKRRLEDARDHLRIEIEAALQRDIPVIPVLVQGANVPAEDLLPETIRSLAYRNGVSIRPDPDF